MIYVIRHGQTDRNRAGRLQGRSDIPLNEKGREEARSAGEYFSRHGISFSRVYSSPLNRAVETAEIVSGMDRTDIICDPLLLEMDYGPYEGISMEDPPAEILTFFSDFIHNPAPDGMEQLSQVVARGGQFLEYGKEVLEGEDGDQDILISTHAIAMKGMLEYLTPESRGSYWSRFIGNCSVYRFDLTDGCYSIPEEFL